MKHLRNSFKSYMSSKFSLVVLSIMLGLPAANAQENKAPAANVPAEEVSENLWLTLSLPFYNTYYYRGIELYSDTSFQPSLSATYILGDYGNLGASVWAHIPVGKNQNRTTEVDFEGNVFNFDSANEFVEVDPSVYYDISIDMLTLSVGHIWYTDPNEGSTSVYVNGERVDIGAAAPNTNEVFGTIALDTWLQPSLTVYHDYRRFDYQYYALSLSQRIDSEMIGAVFGDDFNVTPYVLVGATTSGEKVYNDPDGFKHVNVGIRTTFYYNTMRVTPMLQFNFGLDDDFQGVERTKDDVVIGVDVAFDAGLNL